MSSSPVIFGFCVVAIHTVASLGEWGAAPDNTLQGGDIRPKIILLWLNFERTLDKQRGNGEETTVENRSSLSEAMTKKVVRFFTEK